MNQIRYSGRVWSLELIVIRRMRCKLLWDFDLNNRTPTPWCPLRRLFVSYACFLEDTPVCDLLFIWDVESVVLQIHTLKIPWEISLTIFVLWIFVKCDASWIQKSTVWKTMFLLWSILCNSTHYNFLIYFAQHLGKILHNKLIIFFNALLTQILNVQYHRICKVSQYHSNINLFNFDNMSNHKRDSINNVSVRGFYTRVIVSIISLVSYRKIHDLR